MRSFFWINYAINPSCFLYCIVLPGVGKTMIATGIGIEACRAGKKVLFTNANDLMDRLTGSMKAGTLKDTLQKLQKIPLLIIDELSYLKMDKEKESLFF